MEALELHVVDTIRVRDVVVFVEKMIQRFINFFFDRNRDEPVRQAEKRPDDSRAPPTLSVKVREFIRTKEALG